MPKSATLSHAELTELHEFLSVDYPKADPMSLTEAHGFLTAVISSPQPIGSDVWQSKILGGCPEFTSIDQAQRIVSLLLKLYHAIQTTLKRNELFEPLLLEEATQVSSQSEDWQLLAQWCQGYLLGVEIDPIWYQHDAMLARLLPISILAGKFDAADPVSASADTLATDIAYKMEYRQALPYHIHHIYDCWGSLRSSQTTAVFQTPLAACAQDRCGCGSGKLYGKCCGSMMPTVH